MPFNVGCFCGYLSHKWARKLVSRKRKQWISNYGAVMNFKAVAGRLCAGWGKVLLCTGVVTAAGSSGTSSCSVLAVQSASLLLFIVAQNVLTQVLLSLHAVTWILFLKLLWHANEAEDSVSRLKYTWCSNAEKRKWIQSHFRDSA